MKRMKRVEFPTVISVMSTTEQIHLAAVHYKAAWLISTVLFDSVKDPDLT